MKSTNDYEFALADLGRLGKQGLQGSTALWINN